MAKGDSTDREFTESGGTAPGREPMGPSGQSGTLASWFGFQAEIGRGFYAASGFGLMALKYGVEAGVLWFFNQVVYTPLDFVNPYLSARAALIRGGPDWLSWAWILWTLPFLWIAVTMSVRRAADAGLSPSVGLLVLVPILNLITMLALAVAPHRPGLHRVPSRETVSAMHHARSAVMGVGVGLLVAVAMVTISVYVLDIYGTSLFLGTPVIMGAVGGLTFNSAVRRSVSASIGLGMLTVALAGGALLVFALEGVFCVLMAAPIAIPLGGLGGAVGKAIAEVTRRPANGMAAALAFLPIWAGVESVCATGPEYVVVSRVDVNAPPEIVWKHVIDFPELPEPEEWYFRMGIACPTRARILGRGVGAVRHCIFSTGVFVEPIRVWDEPGRLAFDVSDQPPPMFELTPYRHVHPPHLDGALRSKRGEFRLVGLPDGRTRLEGRTWYELDLFPQVYWTLWSDLVIHRIHERVLLHVKRLAESEGLKSSVPRVVRGASETSK
ncbi:MAG: hypothetical protein AB7I30_15250 [Isosphaeraceae bacterium]